MKEYGGEWTEEKLKILGKYLDAYTTVLNSEKGRYFRLIYIDAFAGPGYVPLKSDGVSKFIKGSPKIALDIKDRQFDELLFNEWKIEAHARLKGRFGHEERVKISQGDANEFLKNLNRDWKKYRGVLFIDPFATQLNFSTLKEVASYEALDTWILFPIMAISRIIPRTKKPEDVDPTWAEKLTLIFGGNSWQNFYKTNPQQNVFGDDEVIMDEGVRGILNLYKNQLRSLFGNRLLEESKTFKTDKNSAMFEFIFCVGSKNPKAIEIAKNIARHNIIKPRERSQESSGQQLSLNLGE